jgi:hypothetical protein
MGDFKVEKVVDRSNRNGKRPLLRTSLIIFSSCIVGITQGCVIDLPPAQIIENIKGTSKNHLFKAARK